MHLILQVIYMIKLSLKFTYATSCQNIFNAEVINAEKSLLLKGCGVCKIHILKVCNCLNENNAECKTFVNGVM